MSTEANPQILSDSEADRRKALLAQLQDSLAELGCQSVLARTHRLVLRSADNITGPSGQRPQHPPAAPARNT